MYYMKRNWLIVSSLLLITTSTQAQVKKDSTHTLIVFFDGLRPDYITKELMPNVYAFKQQACYGQNHHSVFPTVTRVNASSYATGSYPGTHGLLGNTVYFPAVDKKHGLNTGDAGDLNKISQSTDGHLLTAISLGEILQKEGAGMMVFSSGSTGQALMQNHTVAGGAVINPSLILPQSFQSTVVNDIGPIPKRAKPNTAQHTWVTDALMKYGLTSQGPLVSAIWFSDPDGSAHSDGIGSKAATASIQSVDHEFGRIIDSLKSRNLYAYYNIIISTDHGFVTHAGKDGLTEFLIQQGLKKDKESEDVIVAEGAIYVENHDADKVKKIVSALQSQPWIGAVFTKSAKPGQPKGWVEGTLSFESIHWNHAERAADILVDENWDDRTNSFGYAGTSYSRGVAGHGGLSPYEVHIPLIAAGPGFKKSYESNLPTSNVDIVPTVLHLHGITIPPTMDGRILTELLQKFTSAKNTVAKKQTIVSTVKHNWGTYTISLDQTVMGKYIYVNYAKTTRVLNSTVNKN
jgi:predicted AlkP superfamily pyrophosphatase or phosphodiesterase